MYQHVVVVGNVGRDPEMRYTPQGTAVTNFTVAVNRRWKNQDGEQQEKTTWFRVTAWGKLAEVTNEHLTKGRLVLVEGEVEASAWMGQDGEPRATLELRAQNVRFLGGKGTTGSEQAEAPAPAPAEEDDLPF